MVFPATIFTPHQTDSLFKKSPVIHRSYRDGEGGDREGGVEDDDKSILQKIELRKRAFCMYAVNTRALRRI
jgi:hypothetical protein